jgi:hypothetical protein
MNCQCQSIRSFSEYCRVPFDDPSDKGRGVRWLIADEVFTNLKSCASNGDEVLPFSTNKSPTTLKMDPLRAFTLKVLHGIATKPGIQYMLISQCAKDAELLANREGLCHAMRPVALPLSMEMDCDGHIMQ